MRGIVIFSFFPSFFFFFLRTIIACDDSVTLRLLVGWKLTREMIVMYRFAIIDARLIWQEFNTRILQQFLSSLGNNFPKIYYLQIANKIVEIRRMKKKIEEIEEILYHIIFAFTTLRYKSRMILNQIYITRRKIESEVEVYRLRDPGAGSKNNFPSDSGWGARQGSELNKQAEIVNPRHIVMHPNHLARISLNQPRSTQAITPYPGIARSPLPHSPSPPILAMFARSRLHQQSGPININRNICLTCSPSRSLLPINPVVRSMLRTSR